MQLGDVLLTMVAFFFWVMAIWIFISIFGDIFRRDDLTGLAKAGWIFLIFILPFLGALIYLITNSDGMAQRRAEDVRGQRAQMDDYVRSVAGSGGAAAEIDKAKQLLDTGAINQAEFEALKAKALA